MGRDAGYNFMRLIEDATRVDEFHSIECAAASITLISTRILRAAQYRGGNGRERGTLRLNCNAGRCLLQTGLQETCFLLARDLVKVAYLLTFDHLRNMSVPFLVAKACHAS